MALRLIERKFQQLEERERQHNEYYHGKEEQVAQPKKDRLATLTSTRSSISRSSQQSAQPERSGTAATTATRRLETIRARSALDRTADAHPEQVRDSSC